MNHHYADIRGRISEPPKWWDERAVPRYVDFSPDELANIYAEECCLLLICCQQCGVEFKVAMSIDAMERFMRLRSADPPSDLAKEMLLADEMFLNHAIIHNTIHYGDPPNIACCGAGPTMNSVPKRVLEYWRKSVEDFQWSRHSSLEREIHHTIEEE